VRISLQSRTRKISFAIFCLATTAFYLNRATRAYIAYHLSTRMGISQLERAVALDPENAEYQARLGNNMMLTAQDPWAAISHYRQAVALNPHIARYWLNLASAFQVTGAQEEQRKALQRAINADPTTPDVAWEAANFFVVRGEREAALREFRAVMQTDDYSDIALGLCWRATGDPDAIEKILPPDPAKHLAFVKLLLEQKESAAAEKIWHHLVALGQPFDPKQALFYVNHWMLEHDVQRAQESWRELASVDTSLRRSLSDPDNLVVNSGFEDEMLNGGFDWQYVSIPSVSVSLDSTEFHGGNRSLSFAFEGGAVADAGFQQLIPVDPSTSYDFSAYAKTEEIDTANGPRFALSDAYAGTSLLVTDELVGTNVWRQIKGTFKTGPGTKLAALKIIRTPGETRVKGKLWIDDVTLSRK